MGTNKKVRKWDFWSGTCGMLAAILQIITICSSTALAGRYWEIEKSNAKPFQSLCNKAGMVVSDT